MTHRVASCFDKLREFTEELHLIQAFLHWPSNIFFILFIYLFHTASLHRWFLFPSVVIMIRIWRSLRKSKVMIGNDAVSHVNKWSWMQQLFDMNCVFFCALKCSQMFHPLTMILSQGFSQWIPVPLIHPTQWVIWHYSGKGVSKGN